MIAGSEEGYAIVNRAALHQFLVDCKLPSGGIALHVGGEVDIRGTYCAIMSAYVTNALDEELSAGVSDYIASC
jgi:protein farnesyltransferase subunit beta